MPMPAVKGSITNGTSKDRDEHDFYETPQQFTRELLKRCKFHNKVWEPAAGRGAIVEVLEDAEYDVLSTDIVKRGPIVRQRNFLTTDAPCDRDIITNPPFKLLVPFLTHAYKLCHQKFAMVMPISGLNSSKRYQAAWSFMPVSQIILSGRYQHISSYRGMIPSQFTHIWVVVDKGHEGKPTFEWTPDIVYKSE